MLTTKVGTTSTVIVVEKLQSMVVRLVVLTVLLATIVSERSALRSRPTASKVTSSKNILTVLSTATAKASSSARPVATLVKFDEVG